MANVIVGHPDADFSGYLRVAGRGLLFTQGFTEFVDLTAAQQTVLTSTGFTVDGEPETPVPDPFPQYLTEGKAATAIGGTGPLGVAGRAASVAAVEDAADVAPAGVWDFVQTPTVGGSPIGGSALVVNVKDHGAVGNGTTDDTTALQAAVDALDDSNGGVVWFPPGRYNFTALNITTKRVTLDGPGTLLNGTVNIGVQTGFAPLSLYTRIHVGFDRTAKSTTVNAIHVANAHNIEIADLPVNNYRALVHFPALALGGTNIQHSARIRISGIRTPSWPDASDQSIDYLAYVSPNTSGGLFSVGDLTITANASVYCRVAHLAGGGLDGLVCTDNTFFFAAAGDTRKTSNIDLSGDNDQLKIADNQLFEAGYEAIKLNDPRNVSITGNQIVWSGQRDLKDAISITLSSVGYARGPISGNNIQNFTKAVVGVYGTGDASGITIGPNASLVESTNPHYYGTATQPASGTLNRYYSDAGLQAQPRITEFTGAYYADETHDSIGGFVTNSSQRLGLRSAIGGRSGQAFFATTTSAVALGTLSGVLGSAILYGGLVNLFITDSAPNHGANYLLNVAGTFAGKTVTVVNVVGEQQAFTESPHFTFTINSSNQLVATPVSPTVGTYLFYVSTIGSVRFS